MKTDINFYKKNGYLVKKNLISKVSIDKINKIVKELISKEKTKQKNKNRVSTQTYDNFHFVYNSNSLRDKEILRLNNPQNRHKVFYDLSRNKKIISIVKKILGGTVRFHLGKLNFKLPNKKKIYNHHNKNNYFVGKIDTKNNKIGFKNAISITGTAGTVVFFHCRSIHGSGHNKMNTSRPLILFGYRACDAWPLINDGNPHPEENLENYNKNIIVGKKTIKPRMTTVPTIIPLPKKKHYVSIYELQK